MSEIRHTPGPWRIRESLLGSHWIEAGDAENPQHVVLVMTEDTRTETVGNTTTMTKTIREHAAGDARLIASAPHLVDTARQCLDVLEHIHAYLRKHESRLPPVSLATLEVQIELTRAAIDTATGGSQ